MNEMNSVILHHKVVSLRVT